MNEIRKLDFKSKEKFSVGDTVYLKSGSPALTVRFYSKGHGTQQNTVMVDWFLQGEHNTAAFIENQLVFEQTTQEEQ